MRRVPSHARVYVGCYSHYAPGQLPWVGSKKPGTGITMLELDRSDGSLSATEKVVAQESPTWLEPSPCGSFLIAVEDRSPQTGAPEGAGQLHSYRIAADGELELVSSQATGGHGNTCVSFDRSGNFLLTTRYWDSGFSVLPFNAADGTIGEMTASPQHQGSGPIEIRQSVPHPHGVFGDPTADRVFVADLGTDEVVQYQLNLGTGEVEQLSAVHFGPGSGPRGMVFHPNLPIAYVNNELGGSIVMCHIDEAAGLVPQQAHEVYPEGFTCGGHPENLGRSPKYWASEAAMTVDGKCLYVICRVLHAITTFDVAADGSLALRGHTPLVVGSNARNLCVDPAGDFLLIASQDANAVESFRIGEDGTLSRVGLFPAPCPADVAVLPII